MEGTRVTERTYTFEYACPNCGMEAVCTGTRECPPPKLHCGECLSNHAAVVKLSPVRVWVNQGEEA